MSLVRALASVCIALSLAFGTVAQGNTARAGSITSDPADAALFDHPTVIVATDAIQARSIRVLAALLVALTTSGPQGVSAPPDRVAELERLLASKLIEDKTTKNISYLKNYINNTIAYNKIKEYSVSTDAPK